MTRPATPRPTPPGYQWHAEPEDDERWRLSDPPRRCRASRGKCHNQSVAELNRGRYTRAGRVSDWWAYCSEHLYGRWIEQGRLMVWRLRPDTAAEPEHGKTPG